MTRFYKNWPMPNIVGHPVMEILNWVGASRLAKKVHDGALPLEKLSK